MIATSRQRAKPGVPSGQAIRARCRCIKGLRDSWSRIRGDRSSAVTGAGVGYRLWAGPPALDSRPPPWEKIFGRCRNQHSPFDNEVTTSNPSSPWTIPMHQTSNRTGEAPMTQQVNPIPRNALCDPHLVCDGAAAAIDFTKGFRRDRVGAPAWLAAG
jgi:hypothetical protein